MVRVLTYGLSSNRGGIETSLLRVANHIGPKGHELHYVESKSAPSSISADLQSLGHTVHPVVDRKSGLGRNRADWEQLLDFVRPEVVHMHLNTLSYVLPAKLALARGIAVIMHSHSSGSPPGRYRTRALDMFNARTFPMDRVTRAAVSRPAGDWLFGKRDYRILHNAVDLDAFRFDPATRAAVRAALRIEDAFAIGHVGIFSAVKNQHFSLDVLVRLLKIVPNAVMVFVGSGGAEESVKERARLLGVSDHTLFLGTRTDVPSILSALDAIVFPSLYEGFPNVALEAQASSLPTLVSDAVTDELMITNRIEQLPLGLGPEPWVEALARIDSTCSPLGRNTVSDRLKREFSPDAEASGYDDLYLSSLDK